MVVNMFHQSINSKASHPYEAFVFQNHNMAAHFHRNYEAVYVFEGSLEHNVDGRTLCHPDVSGNQAASVPGVYGARQRNIAELSLAGKYS